ncbi:MAG: hypothetical protein ACRYFK_07095 [Janthinobacterium lividum]
MNPRDLPEVVSELIIELHEVRSELRALREDMQTMPDRIGAAMFKLLEPFLNRLLDHADQLKSHENRLNNLERPQ